jgi:hypothetical protein
MEDMLIKKNEGQINLPIGPKVEEKLNDKTECLTGPVTFSEIIDKNRVSAAKLQQFHQYGVEMDQSDDFGDKTTIPPSIPELEININQERTKGKQMFGPDFMWDSETQFLNNFKTQLDMVEDDIERESLKNLLVDFNQTFYNVEKPHFFKGINIPGVQLKMADGILPQKDKLRTQAD